MHPVQRTRPDMDVEQQPDPHGPDTLLAVQPPGLSKHLEAMQTPP